MKSKKKNIFSIESNCAQIFCDVKIKIIIKEKPTKKIVVFN